jgi:hypothetical protein
MLACKLPRDVPCVEARDGWGSSFNQARKEIYMAKCIYCGAETQLHSGAVPICLVCAVDLQPQRKPPLLERLPGGSTSSRPSSIFASPVHESVACSECAALEADRLEAIRRYVDLRAARQCLLRECPTVVPVLDTALISVEKILNDAWRKLAEHQSRHALPASA